MIEIETNQALLKKKSLTILPDMFKTGEAEEIESLLKQAMNEQAKKNKRRPLALSAIQIGKAYQMCIITTFLKRPKTLINPVILEKTGLCLTNFETCLSFPGKCFGVKRYNKVTVRYLNMSGKLHIKTFKGQPARQIQHECDHMRGIVPTKDQFKSGEIYLENRRK